LPLIRNSAGNGKEPIRYYIHNALQTTRPQWHVDRVFRPFFSELAFFPDFFPYVQSLSRELKSSEMESSARCLPYNNVSAVQEIHLLLCVFSRVHRVEILFKFKNDPLLLVHLSLIVVIYAGTTEAENFGRHWLLLAKYSTGNTSLQLQ
jgi:hypothetical protein